MTSRKESTGVLKSFGSPRSVVCFESRPRAAASASRCDHTICRQAQSGDVEAQYLLGCWYLEGSNGMKQSQEDAKFWFLRAGEAGDAEAQWQLALLAIQEHDELELIFWCQKAADQNHVLALKKLAMLHLGGSSILKPAASIAFHLFSRAAECGDVDAQLQVGEMYERGFGCRKNFAEAARCYVRLIRKEENPTAMFHLGNLYMMGDGVKPNTIRAFKLWERAAELGHKEASNFITLRELGLE